MNWFSFFCVMVLSIASVQAQEIKGFVTVGVSGNQIDGDLLAGYHLVGAYGGLGIKADVSDGFELSFQLNLARKGARNPANALSVSLLYIDAPVVASYVYKDFRFGLGAYVARLASAKARQGAIKNDISTLLNKNDYGLALKLAIAVIEELDVELGTEYSLRSIRKDPVVWYNNTIQLGIRYGF